MFTEIKVLGLSTTVGHVDVLQNGGTIPSSHKVNYDSTTQVRRCFWHNATFTAEYVFLSLWGFSSRIQYHI